jgi:hypothetical protein
MKQLSREAFERARQFLRAQARPLERALFEYHFEGSMVERVFAELAYFQNDDGGFGHALEPDLRTPSSSALATGIGLHLLQELGCSMNHPMVRRAASYLIATYRADLQAWPVAPADTNSFPHAPWWHDTNGNLAQRFDYFRISPRARLVGLLHHFSSLVPADWLDQATAATIKYIEEVEVLGGGGGSDLEYAINLAETENLPQHYRTRLNARIRQAIPAVVVRDPVKWSTYCITPLRICRSSDTLGADLIQGELQLHLDYQLEHQMPEGNWEPSWSWGELIRMPGNRPNESGEVS